CAREEKLGPWFAYW
nr:immunoglobulin heavy chain junction region [Mus musculus]